MSMSMSLSVSVPVERGKKKGYRGSDARGKEKGETGK
jgi:hypothetical protein